MKKLLVLAVLLSSGLLHAEEPEEQNNEQKVEEGQADQNDAKKNLRAQLEKVMKEELQDCFARCEKKFKHDKGQPTFDDGRIEDCIKTAEEGCIILCNKAADDKAKRLQIEVISRAALVPSQLINEQELPQFINKMRKKDQNQ